MSFTVVRYSYHVSPDHLHHVFTPIRAYYHLMRWIFGKDCDPFATTVKEGLHPLPAFMKYHQNKLQKLYFALIYIIPTLVLAFMLHGVQRIVFKRIYGQMKK